MKNNNLSDIPNLPPPSLGKSDWPWLPDQVPFPVYKSRSSLPQISIVTPSFNQGQFIEETIRSVLLQGYPNLEYIIIDGGSTDGSIEIIKKYEPWLAYWESEPDQGQSHALNKGFEHATGELMAWLNTDDIYLPGALFRVADAFQKGNAQWIVGITLITDADLKILDRFMPSLYTASGRDINYESMGWIDFVCTKSSGIALPQPSSFWLRSAVLQAGGIDETLRYAMDHELYGKLAYQGFRPTLLEESLSCFRTHPEQKTAHFPVIFWQEELKIVRYWENRVNGLEKEKLRIYGEWLYKQIKYHPYNSFFQSMKSGLSNILKLFFGSRVS
ncbi:MAG: glycosyltransferase [Chloroflexi bacterium]|nr:glycosyltransferase [Chloroflexota bacterium]